MNKPGQFRAALLAALPDLAADPQKLSIYVDRGHIRATNTPGHGWEYVYQLTAIIQDFAGDFDALASTIVQWLRTAEPDMLGNPDARNRGIRYEVEMLSNELADVQVEIDLTEACYPGTAGQPVNHPAEPPADPTAAWLLP